MRTYILHRPEIVELSINGRLKNCIISEAECHDDPFDNEWFISLDEALVEKLRPYIEKLRCDPGINPDIEIMVKGYCIEWYDFGGEYVKRYDEFLYYPMHKNKVKNVNGIEYLDLIKDIYNEINIKVGVAVQETPIKYTGIKFRCQHDNYGNPIEGCEPEAIGEALKKQYFVKYDPQLHPIVESKHYKVGYSRQSPSQ